jgi:hypothetical protein
MSVFEPDVEACFAKKLLLGGDCFPISPSSALRSQGFNKSIYYWLILTSAEERS